MPYVSNLKVSFEGLLDTHDLLYHVSPDLIVEFSYLIDTALRNPRHRVGATKWGKMELVLEGGINPVTLAKGQILKQILNDPDESKALIDDYARALEIEVNRPKLPGDVMIRQRLSVADQMQLRRNYPEYQIIFSGTPINTEHGYYAASRVLARRKLMDLLNYVPGESHTRGKQFSLKEVGPNIMDVFDNDPSIHGCAPILGHDDSERYSKRRHFIVQSAKRKNQGHITGRQLDRLESEVLIRSRICHRRAQDCPIRTDCVMFNHSAYDITPTEMADIMDTAGAHMGVGVVIRLAEAQVLASGEVDEIFWRVFYRDSVKLIEIGFVNDNSRNYVHNYATYISIIALHPICSSSGKLYYLESQSCAGREMFFNIVPNIAKHVEPAYRLRNVWTTLDDYQVITFPMPSDTPYMSSKPSAYVMTTILMKTDVVDRVRASLFTTTQQKFTTDSVGNLLRSSLSRTVINGVDIIASKDQVNFHQFTLAVAAIYIDVYRTRFLLNKTIKDAIAEELDERTFDSRCLLSKVPRYLWRRLKDVTLGNLGLMEKSTATASAEIADETSIPYLRKLVLGAHMAMRLPKTFNPRIYSFRFMPVQTYLNGIIQSDGMTVEDILKSAKGPFYGGPPRQGADRCVVNAAIDHAIGIAMQRDPHLYQTVGDKGDWNDVKEQLVESFDPSAPPPPSNDDKKPQPSAPPLSAPSEVRSTPRERTRGEASGRIPTVPDKKDKPPPASIRSNRSRDSSKMTAYAERRAQEVYSEELKKMNQAEPIEIHSTLRNLSGFQTDQSRVEIHRAMQFAGGDMDCPFQMDPVLGKCSFEGKNPVNAEPSEYGGLNNCLYDCLIMGFGLRVDGRPATASWLRGYLAKSRFRAYLEEGEKLAFIEETSKGSQASGLVISVFCMAFRAQVCVHSDMGDMRYDCGGTTNAPLHLCYRPGHYMLFSDRAVSPQYGPIATREKEVLSCFYPSLELLREQYMRIVKQREQIDAHRVHYDLDSARARYFGLATVTAAQMGYLTRSGPKLQELLKTVKQPLRGKSVLDVSGARGGMTQYLLARGANVTYTYYPQSSEKLHWRSLRLRPKQRLIVTPLDMTDEEQLDALQGTFSLINCDASADRVNFYTQEQDNWPIWRNVTRLLPRLERGGTLIVKLLDFVYDESWQWLAELCKSFADVSVRRVSISRPASSEKFLVATGFGGSCHFAAARRDVLSIMQLQLGGLLSLTECLVDPGLSHVLEEHDQVSAIAACRFEGWAEDARPLEPVDTDPILGEFLIEDGHPSFRAIRAAGPGGACSGSGSDISSSIFGDIEEIPKTGSFTDMSTATPISAFLETECSLSALSDVLRTIRSDLDHRDVFKRLDTVFPGEGMRRPTRDELRMLQDDMPRCRLAGLEHRTQRLMQRILSYPGVEYVQGMLWPLRYLMLLDIADQPIVSIMLALYGDLLLELSVLPIYVLQYLKENKLSLFHAALATGKGRDYFLALHPLFLTVACENVEPNTRTTTNLMRIVSGGLKVLISSVPSLVTSEFVLKENWVNLVTLGGKPLMRPVRDFAEYLTEYLTWALSEDDKNVIYSNAYTCYPREATAVLWDRHHRSTVGVRLSPVTVCKHPVTLEYAAGFASELVRQETVESMVGVLRRYAAVRPGDGADAVLDIAVAVLASVDSDTVAPRIRFLRRFVTRGPDEYMVVSWSAALEYLLNLPDLERSDEVNERGMLTRFLKTKKSTGVFFVKGSLFDVNSSMAHCVSADLAMKAGIAPVFVNHVSSRAQNMSVHEQKNRLCELGIKIGSAPYIEAGGHYYFYLITKQNFYDKPDLSDFVAALCSLKKNAIKLKLSEIHVPMLGCGRDMLSPEIVRQQLIKQLTGLRVVVHMKDEPLMEDFVCTKPEELEVSVSDYAPSGVEDVTTDCELPEETEYPIVRKHYDKLATIGSVDVISVERVYTVTKEEVQVERPLVPIRTVNNNRLTLAQRFKNFVTGKKTVSRPQMDDLDKQVATVRYQDRDRLLTAVPVTNPAIARDDFAQRMRERRADLQEKEKEKEREKEKAENVQPEKRTEVTSPQDGSGNESDGGESDEEQKRAVLKRLAKRAYDTDLKRNATSVSLALTEALPKDKVIMDRENLYRTINLTTETSLPVATFIPSETPLVACYSRKEVDEMTERSLIYLLMVNIRSPSVSVTEPWMARPELLDAINKSVADQVKYSAIGVGNWTVLIRLYSEQVLVELHNTLNELNQLRSQLRIFFDLSTVSASHTPTEVMRIFRRFDSVSYRHRFGVVVEAGKPMKLVKEALTHFRQVRFDDPDRVDEIARATLSPLRAVELYYDPKVLEGDDQRTFALNAMEEIQSCWKTKMHLVAAELGMWSAQMPTKPGKSFFKTLGKKPKNIGVYCMNEKNWLLVPSNGKTDHEMGFYNGRLIPMKSVYKMQILVTGATTVFVNDDTYLMNDRRLAEAVDGVIDKDSYEPPHMTLVNGVPGCGKTTFILERVRLPDDKSRGDLVLFSTKEAREDFEERLCRKYPRVKDKPFLKKNYRTLDSFIIHHAKQTGAGYARLFVDEALMSHAGQLLLACAVAKVKEVMLLGDVNQVPFINRMSNVTVKYHQIANICHNTIQLKLSYRITKTVAALISKSYGGGVKTTNNVSGEMSWRQGGVSAIDRNTTNHHILTFKQSEKDLVISSGLTNVSTIHEYQGKQSERITIFRHSQNKETLYESEPHILVGISRHTKKLEYVTSVTTDNLCKLIDRGQEGRMSQRELDDAYANPEEAKKIQARHAELGGKAQVCMVDLEALSQEFRIERSDDEKHDHGESDFRQSQVQKGPDKEVC